MEQTTPTRITLPLSVLAAVVEAVLEDSAVLSVLDAPPCALEEQPPSMPAAIAAAMVRDRTRVAFFIVSPSFCNVRSAFFSRISPDQTKSAQPRRQAGAARLCAKANSLLFLLYAFCPGTRTGPAAFALRTPLSLFRVWIVWIIAYRQNFASTFCHLLVLFPGFVLHFIKPFLWFLISNALSAFFFSVKPSAKLTNRKYLSFSRHHQPAPGGQLPTVPRLVPVFVPILALLWHCLSDSLSAKFLSSAKSHIVSRYIVLYICIALSYYFYRKISSIFKYYIFCEQSLYEM